MSKRATNTAKILLGLGRRISGMSKTMQASSQTISSSAVASHGMAMRSASRRRSFKTRSSWGMFLVDAIAQFVHEVDEVRLEGGAKRARPRDVDPAAEHDAARPPAHDVD